MDHRDWEHERAHLEEILTIVRKQLQEAGLSDQARAEALTQAQREMHDMAAQMFQNLWSAQDFEALADLNQYAQPLAVSQQTHHMALERGESLGRMLGSPYFARIDMRFDDGGDTEEVYIGRATLKDDHTHDIYVHDWRAPISSVFYRFGVGRALYDAPGGQIAGEVLLKRQYEIRRGELKYFFDADVAIQDEFLRQLLSKNASPRMKAIVETIQRDQDVAIRDTEHELLMVQGVAGSGKTSIALHRVAYLMYEGLASRLQAGHILILSPNALFERYIAGVLPELGERATRTVTPWRLFSRLLEGARVMPAARRFEAMCAADTDTRGRMAAGMAFKSSRAFMGLLDRLVEALPRMIDFQDVRYGGQVIAKREQLRERILRLGKGMPLGVELRRVELSLWDAVRALRPARMDALRANARRVATLEEGVEPLARAYSILESGALRRHIRRFTTLDSVAVYRAFMGDEGALRRLAQGDFATGVGDIDGQAIGGQGIEGQPGSRERIPLPEGLTAILRDTCAALDGGVLSPEDAAAAAYLKLRIHGAGASGDIRQVVVDEAQDYGALSFAALHLLFPHARFTVLGDINQALDRPADMSLYTQVRDILGCRSSALVELTKSFRCTMEILQFSLALLGPDVEAQSFNRSGDAPRVISAQARDDLDALIGQEVALCRERGYRSIALIAKTAREARAWHARLAPKMDIRMVEGGDGETGDVFIIPLALAKGLEFDAVLVLDADRAHYGQAQDARVLYVACTRALHRLNLFCVGRPSPLLEREEERP